MSATQKARSRKPFGDLTRAASGSVLSRWFDIDEFSLGQSAYESLTYERRLNEFERREENGF